MRTFEETVMHSFLTLLRPGYFKVIKGLSLLTTFKASSEARAVTAVAERGKQTGRRQVCVATHLLHQWKHHCFSSSVLPLDAASCETAGVTSAASSANSS